MHLRMLFSNSDNEDMLCNFLKCEGFCIFTASGPERNCLQNGSSSYQGLYTPPPSFTRLNFTRKE